MEYSCRGNSKRFVSVLKSISSNQAGEKLLLSSITAVLILLIRFERYSEKVSAALLWKCKAKMKTKQSIIEEIFIIAKKTIKVSILFMD